MSVCTCTPCERPDGVGGSQPGRHCAGCCMGTLIEEYDPRCALKEHRELAGRQFNISMCIVHTVPEPCPTCRAYIAAGL